MDAGALEAEPVELVRMLYRGAVDALAAARESLQQADIAGRGREAGRAAAIVVELATSLDHDAGGEISRNLSRLYDYILGLILKANLEQVDAPFAEAQQLLTTLLEAWNQCRPDSAVLEPEDAFA